ncbi:unannotated protein [freshwater metagenome]|uniref:Unannotated protein n=1 Tax=freshwater metagenome TaxID=449393 RepID=A0A6J7JR69_9ZZZZ
MIGSALVPPVRDGPAELWAITVNVYEVPFDRPVQVALVPTTTHDPPVGSWVSVYSVMGDPPVSTGGVHVRAAVWLPTSPRTPVGGSGTVRGVPLTVVTAPSPTTLRA